MRTLLFATLALLTLAPLAAAQDTNETPDDSRPDDAAWVEDCPPDMMCAANEPRPYGDEDCIECSGPAPSDDTGTCMDGAQEGEVCDDDVQYLDGRGPADCEYCRGDAVDEDAEPISAPVETESDATQKNDVPAAGLGVIVAAFALAVVLVARKL